MPYLTEALLAKRNSIPVSLPLTQLKKSDWLLLTTVKLSVTQIFSYKFLQLQLVELTIEGTSADNICALPEPALINPSNGLAYVAIYKNYSINTNPKDITAIGTTDDFVKIAAVGIEQRDVTKPPLIIQETANFSFILVNNTSNADLRLAVNGEVTVSL